MTIDTLEQIIRERKLQVKTLSEIRNRIRYNNNILQAKVMNNIEAGSENYHIKSLMSYLYGLDIHLLINGVRVITPADFGKQLKIYRESQSMTRKELSLLTDLSADRIKAIENGCGKRSNIVKYLNGFPNIPIELR